jgi:hypothetical protein
MCNNNIKIKEFIETFEDFLEDIEDLQDAVPQADCEAESE